MHDIPLYSDEVGYGFVNETGAMPSRKVDVNLIKHKDDIFIIKETDERRFNLIDNDNNILSQENCSTYNFGGMVYRICVKPGAYKIEVVTTSGKKDTSISICGMQATKIINSGYWDAAGLISIKHHARWNKNTWIYEYVSGQNYIDIEIEPLYANIPIGMKGIKITAIENQIPGDKPTIFLLGDSTAKSYVFEEAPMSSWGQVLGELFDNNKVNVVNYSNGGRSLKFMYIEGRLNDLLLNGKSGDFVFLQSGHNDERSGCDIGTADGEKARFGRGSTEKMFYKFLTNIFIPAIRSRGMIPILITPVTRMDASTSEGTIIKNSFVKRKFPQVIKRVGKELNITVVDLNSRSVKYMNKIGVEGTKAIVMSIEPGETPGKTNNGSYANGNPGNKADGTHYKEALSKQYSRMIIEELYNHKNMGDKIAGKIISYINPKVKQALESKIWHNVYPEVCLDIIIGKGAYYRNQIEKIVQLGVMQKDDKGNFNPFIPITVKEYINAVASIYKIDSSILCGYKDGILRREVMGSILYDAYGLRFGYSEKSKPKYMTDYNGSSMRPDEQNFDPNLTENASQYYPTVTFDKLNDIEDISFEFIDKIRKAYNLGIIRSESGIARGCTKNGTSFEPKAIVSREKAAKSLYFIWVLSNEVKIENHKSSL